MGHVYFELGQFQTALEFYQKSLHPEVAESREETTVGLIQTNLALGQIKEATLQLQKSDLKGKVFAAWKAVFAIQLEPAKSSEQLHLQIREVFGLVQEISALNACECLVSLLEPVAQLEPMFAKRFAMSLLQDQRSSFYVLKLANAFVGDTTSTPELPWKSSIKEF